MNRVLLITSAAALALAGTSSASIAGSTPGLKVRVLPTHKFLLPQRDAKLLYDQTDNDNGTGIDSQNFTDSGFDVYDCQGADEFTVPAGSIWKIKEVYVDGTYFDGAGSADSFSVTFYSSGKGKVGDAVKTCPEASYYFDTQFDFGSEHIRCSARLNRGTYFVSVQANMAFSVGGQWGWLTNNTVRNNLSMWRNPGDGFDTGCTDFATTTTCIPSGEGGDYSFALYGKEI
jgi:hypothetical protein